MKRKKAVYLPFWIPGFVPMGKRRKQQVCLSLWPGMPFMNLDRNAANVLVGSYE
jgi:hypothetical protein